MVSEWEMGLPSDEDLASLSQSLIPRNLAMAFSITPERRRTSQDVNQASEATLSLLRAEEEDRVGSSKSTEGDSGTAPKRPRLVWTPQLHKRFVDVVAHLGITNAVPKTIMQLMNVQGLTRENVASHLQKYRLYLKRMQRGEAPSSADNLFSSAPMPVYAHHMPMPSYPSVGAGTPSHNCS